MGRGRACHGYGVRGKGDGEPVLGEAAARAGFRHDGGAAVLKRVLSRQRGGGGDTRHSQALPLLSESPGETEQDVESGKEEELPHRVGKPLPLDAVGVAMDMTGCLGSI